MPPRHAYWTILIDNQPTAFRAHDPEELLPTLNRLREKNDSAVMKWFERGQLFDSRDAAREAGMGRGERRWEGPRPDRDQEGRGRSDAEFRGRDPERRPRQPESDRAERPRSVVKVEDTWSRRAHARAQLRATQGRASHLERVESGRRHPFRLRRCSNGCSNTIP